MIIYKSTNKITEKIYIGQTTHTLDKRIKNHIKESKIESNRPFMTSIKNYGIGNFVFEIIDSADNLNELNDKEINLFPYLNGMAMIRELHVYGMMTPLKNAKQNDLHSHQHKGYGKMLIKKAEEIAIDNHFKKIGVISGVGVRKYYEKLGYKLENNYMVKELHIPYNIPFNYIVCCILVIYYLSFSIIFLDPF